MNKLFIKYVTLSTFNNKLYKIMFLEFLKIPVGDPVAITFFMGYIAMFAASIFFFIERGSVDGKWKLSLLVSGFN